jgi:hypothetical protein
MILKNKFVLITTIHKKTKKERNRILLKKGVVTPLSKNLELKIKTLSKIKNMFDNSLFIKFKNKLENKLENSLLLKLERNKKKNIYKIIEMKKDTISFKRPLFLNNEQKLSTNEDINNKRIIKLNRPLSLKEFMFQFDFNTYIDKILSSLLDKMNKYSSSLINLVETKVLTNKEKSLLFNDKVKNIKTLLFHASHEKNGFNELKVEIERWYIYYHLLLPLYLFMFNKAKFTMNFMEKLTHLVKNLYNKEVVFNIVNLKKMHLSSDIYTQAVALKLKNRDNKLYRVLKSSLRKIKIPDFSKINAKNNKLNKDEFLDNKIRNSLINSMFTAEQEDVKDPLNNLLLNFFPSAENIKKSVVKKGSVKNYSISLKDYVLMYLKHIKIRGIRVEAKGRLTRRFTASRSVFKMK